MTDHRYSYCFASDNTAPATPEALASFAAEHHENVGSYGSDPTTSKAIGQLREYFAAPLAEIFFVNSGTAANALAISALRRSFESVFCTGEAHIERDESAAPEFFAQGLKLHLVGNERGDKIDLDKMRQVFKGNRGMHSAQPKLISITQTTELGTCYQSEEINELRQFADQHQLYLHMDGARFANALASTGATPAEMSHQAGIDVLSLGGTKNGVCTSEVLIFFKPELAQGFLNLRKQGGQLMSKMRYLSAPWIGALPHFLSRAQHANAMAKKLAGSLESLGIKVAFPVQSNAVFVHFPQSLVDGLHQRGWHFYWFMGADIYRLMCAWNATDEAQLALMEDVRSVLNGR